MIFLHVFLSILDNIGLYIYTVTYRSNIKIPSFLQNISINFFLKSLKFFKLISSIKKQKKKNKKIFYFHVCDQILKVF